MAEDEDLCCNHNAEHTGSLVKKSSPMNSQDRHYSSLAFGERAERMADLIKRRKAELAAKTTTLKPAVRFIGDLTSINETCSIKSPIEIVSLRIGLTAQ